MDDTNQDWSIAWDEHVVFPKFMNEPQKVTFYLACFSKKTMIYVMLYRYCEVALW